MNRTTPAWSTPREMVQIVLAPQHLKRVSQATVLICPAHVIVGAMR
jgi:hypothetical protein